MASRRTIGERFPGQTSAEREAASGFALHGNTVVWRLRHAGLEPRPYYEFFKRLFDIFIASLAILATLPLMLAIALAIKLDSRGPVLYSHQRLGKGTRRFIMLKFRTMRVSASAIPPELLMLNESTGPLFKMRGDPRITRVGRLLRRTSLDELPQLFNVLLGQMSIVGPRPPLPRELAGFETVQRQRLRVVPGLAGLWQVKGRSNLAFEEMVKLDLEYIERRSFLFDLELILQTIPCVITGRGAW